MNTYRHHLLTFAILLVSFGASYGQWGDCDNSVDACTNPSFNVTPSGFGNVEEFDAINFGVSNPQTNPNASPGNMGCLLSGELNSTWLLITVTGSGTLEFSMGTAGSFNCFDWIMWPYDPATACNNIANNTLPPVACNWNGACTGITGMANAGNLPAGGDPSDFENGLNVNAGDQFMVCFSNFSSASTAVPLDFFGTAQVTCGNTIGATICSGESTYVVALGGTAYNWDTSIPGFINTSATGDTAFVNPTVTTDYIVDITMGNGTIQQDVATVTVHAPLNASASGIDETCLGDADGSISALAPGGTAPIDYTLSGAATGNNSTGSFTNLGPGNYTIDIVDANGCTDQVQVTLNPGPVCCSMTLTTTGTDISCNGVCDGTVQVDTAGAFPPISIQWYDAGMTPIAGGTTMSMNNLCAGTYIVEVTDALCTITEQITITEPTALTFTTAVTDLTCYQDNTGAIDFAANGGTLPYEFSIDNGATFQSGNSFNGLSAGTYHLIVQDANMCQSTAIVDCFEPSLLTLALQATDNTCNSVNAPCDGEATVAVNGGTQPYLYTWGSSIAGPNDITASDVCMGNYSLTVTDVNGCTADTNFMINEPPVFAFANNQALDPTCTNICDGSIDIDAPGAITYSIDNGTTTQSNPLFTDLCGGTYDLLVTDINGCPAATSITITTPDPVISGFSFTPEQTTFFQSEITFINLSQNATSYVWNIDENGEQVNYYTANPMHTFPGDQPGTYHVCLIAVDEFNCSDTSCLDVVIDDEFFVYVPNAFTPDNDGVNDIFYVNAYGYDAANYEFTIFNKWGNVIFQSDSPSATWDGTFKGSPAKEDVYIWKLETRVKSTTEERTFSGHVSLIR